MRLYRERGPYDMVLIGFRLPGLDGSDLALAIRRANPAQRITIIMDSASVGQSIRRKLGDIPVLKFESVYRTMGELRKRGRLPTGEGQPWLDSVEATLAIQTKRSKTAMKSRTTSGKKPARLA